MARPCFKSERRAQSVRVVLFNERDSGVSAARAFLPSLSEPGGASAAGPATAGRVNSYCRPALAPGNRLWRSPTASLAATTSSEGPAVFSARVQTPGKALGRAAGRDWAGPRPQACLRSWPKNGPARIPGPADGSSDLSPQVASTGHGHRRLTYCAGSDLRWQVCKSECATIHAAITLQPALQEPT